MVDLKNTPGIPVGETGVLLPRSDGEKEELLRQGKPIRFKINNEASESEEAKRKDRQYRTIKTEWLEALAPKPSRIVQVPIEIDNAVIVGPLNLQHVTFKYELSITNSEFEEVPVCSVRK